MATLLNPSPPPQLHLLSRRGITFSAAALIAVESHLARQRGAAVALADDGASCVGALPVTRKVFFDVSIGGEPAGRITVGLFDAPLAAARFASLSTGVGYRRKEFNKIMPGAYIQHGGVVSVPAVAGFAEALAAENAALSAKCGSPSPAGLWRRGTVGMVIRDPTLPPPRVKLVAKGGKVEVEEEQDGVVPNATEWVVVTGDKAAPEMEKTAVLVGRVVEGMETVERIAGVAAVKENSSSPYFRVAKLIGDKRAVVAERGFNRPYTKILVTNCGLLD